MYGTNTIILSPIAFYFLFILAKQVHFRNNIFSLTRYNDAQLVLNSFLYLFYTFKNSSKFLS